MLEDAVEVLGNCESESSEKKDSLNLIIEYVKHNYNPNNLYNRLYLREFFDQETYDIWKSIKNISKEHYKLISKTNREHKYFFRSFQRMISYGIIDYDYFNITTTKEYSDIARFYNILGSLLNGTNILKIENNYLDQNMDDSEINSYIKSFETIIECYYKKMGDPLNEKFIRREFKIE